MTTPTPQQEPTPGHTPGEWIIHPATSGNMIPIRCEEGFGIANVWGFNEEAQANAHLIAAASAMLEALRAPER